ncbi:MAG: hypothetical protein HY736_15095 [Verrucomicrobia bacterium]|nr:hypothetical protein [Verrucomicrobiota bacterium]
MSLPFVDVAFTVTNFRNVLAASPNGAPLTDHAMTVVSPDPKKVFLHRGMYAKSPLPTTIRVMAPGAVLKFTFVGPGEIYHPVGISFERADGTVPTAVLWDSYPAASLTTPFTGLAITGATLQFTVTPLRGLATTAPGPNPPPYVTYKFSVSIQRQSDQVIGIIDPEIENEN